MRKMVSVLLVAVLSFSVQAPASSQVRMDVQKEELHKGAPGVPDSIVFAGETIRFDRSDLYERMDRELIAFTYMHTNSTLILKRSKRIFAQVTPILKAEGLPEDLKYLMVIESNLDPGARSGAGAAGLWQLMSATAREYGLVVDSEVDQRYDIEMSTRAACAYLKDAYAKFGDWMTVVASYNGGQNGIASRLKSQRQQSALDLWLVEETSRYMFRVLAAKKFMESPEDFGFSVPDSERYPYLPPLRTVTVDGGIDDLVDFAEKNSVSYAALKGANLWLRDSKLVNKAGRTYKIVIPRAGRL